MKKQLTIIAAITLTVISINTKSIAGETSLAAYLTYWDGGENDGYDGSGGGLKLRQKFAGLFSADIRIGYLDFSEKDQDISSVPVETVLMIGLPLMLEPYAGVGAGYCFVDSDRPEFEDGTEIFGVIGVQLNLMVVGAFAEVRYTDSDTDLMDGISGNLGLMIKW